MPPHRHPFNRRSTFIVADGADDTLLLALPKGELRLITAILPNEEGPIRVRVDILHDGEIGAFTVARGWVHGRGGTGTADGGLVKHMNIPLSEASQAQFWVANASGAAVDPIFFATGWRE